MLELIKLSLWNRGDSHMPVDEEDYDDMKMHAVLALPAKYLAQLELSQELKSKWRKAILLQLSFFSINAHVQSALPISVPYTILKGSAAAQYYPCPEFRKMGDIDIMTRREDFETAYHQLLENGYEVFDSQSREVCFVKDSVVIELHRFFASLNDPKQSQYLDDLIIDNISPSHVLPDPVNGLVLLEHISQHLEHGLGLRQIIDWMLFVDRCLPDEKWPEFKAMAKNIGLKKLAVIITRMCEIHLGLEEREWSKDADETVCNNLMDYILSCGDFGKKWTSDLHVGQTVFTYVRGPVATYKWLQERGLINWKAAQRHTFLRPFAWIYQAGRYISRIWPERIFRYSEKGI